MIRIVIIFSVFLTICKLSTSGDVMKSLGLKAAKAVNDCRTELGLSDHVFMELYHFWKLSEESPDRQVGCTLKCVATKLNIIYESGDFHLENTKELVINAGADEDTVNKFISDIQECFKGYGNLEDDCNKALRLGGCFRDEIDTLKLMKNTSIAAAEVGNPV